MIAPPTGVKVVLCTQPVDFRKGHDGLSAVVQEALRRDPFCGDLFVFRSKRLDRVKILTWVGSGLCLFYKRLETGCFAWPPVRDGVVMVSPAQMAMLLEGLDWSRVRQRSVEAPKAAC